MNLVFQSAFLKALGWSLLDSLWQMGLLWLAYVILTANNKRFTSPQKHSLALLALIGGSLWFLITLAINFYESVNAPVSILLFTIENTNQASWISSIIPLLESALPFLSVIYLIFLCCLFIRYFKQYHQTQQLFSTSIIKADPELRVFMKKMAALLGIKKEISIWISEFVDTPLTIGFWKPIILIPIAAINHLSMGQAESIILHELYHIKRNDYLVNLMIAFLDILLFFNPFTRVLTDIIKRERENSCDDLVMQFRYDPRQYVNALLMLEKNRFNKPVLTVAATGKNKRFLLNRVKRILYQEHAPANQLSQRFAGALFTTVIIAFIGLYNPGNLVVRKMEESVRYTAFNKNDNLELGNALIYNSPFQEYKVDKDRTNVRNHSLIYSANKEETYQPEYSFYQDTEDQDEAVNNLLADVKFVQTLPESSAFSIVETEPVITSPVYSSQYPFIPKNSFSYHYTEDTTLPKKRIITVSEKKAQEAMEQSFKAFEAINWQKLENELGKKVDVKKLQGEIKKALAEVNWKKINEEIQSSLKESAEAYDEVHLQLEKLQESKMAKQEKLHKLKDKLVEDLIKHKEKTNVEDCKEVQKASKAKGKKIVVI